jgi:hypothetical protein
LSFSLNHYALTTRAQLPTFFTTFVYNVTSPSIYLHNASYASTMCILCPTILRSLLCSFCINQQSTSKPQLTNKDKVTMSKPNFSISSVAKALTAFLPRPHPKPQVDQLQKLLDAAKPAEFSYRPPCGLDHAIPADGLWFCCKGHENQLVHCTGAHPFKYIKCRFCDHIICRNDASSEILTRISSLAMESFQERFNAQKTAPHHLFYPPETRSCLVCRSCGLTHRGTIVHSRIEFRTTPCVCGQETEEDDLYFFIGSNAEYRRNPNDKAVDVKLRRTFAELKRATADSIDNYRRPQTAHVAEKPKFAAVEISKHRPHLSRVTTDPNAQEHRRRPTTAVPTSPPPSYTASRLRPPPLYTAPYSRRVNGMWFVD